MRISHQHAAAAADPPAFGPRLAGLHRAGEQQVERGRQQEHVGDHAVGGIEGRIVQHLEIDRAMGCAGRSEEHTSELQSLMRISYDVFSLKKKTLKKK